MIEIGGILFKQPTDKPIVAYNGGKYALIADGDDVERVKLDEFAEADHNHLDEIIRPWLVAGDQYDKLRLQGKAGGSNSYIDILAASSSTTPNQITVFLHGGKKFYVSGAMEIYNSAMDSFKLIGVPSWRTGVADAWNTYACSVSDKEEIKPIENAVSKIQQLNGITFRQDGAEKSGITAEDLEKLELPDATHKENGVFTSVNLTQVIPVLCEAVKALQIDIDALKGGK